MRQIEKTVFISYRRTNAPWALAIFQALTNHGYDVFLDYTSIAAGDFEQVILGNIRARAHFLVLLTPSALERCHEPRDWLRREIETALELRRNIVPLMLEGFDFATPALADHLTGKLAALKQYNALRVPMDYFEAAMTRLRQEYLNIPLEAVLHPLGAAANAATHRQQAAAGAAATVSEKTLSAQEWFEQGFSSTDIEYKIHCYNQSLRLNPNDVLAYHIQGLIHVSKGDFGAAIEAFSQAIRLDPDYFIAYVNRGGSRQVQGDLAGALADYDAALRLNPDYADAYNNRGVARQAQGDLAGALTDYDRALRLNPDYAKAYINRGLVRHAQGDLAGALADYDAALRLNPDDAAVYYNRGNVRYDQGDLAGALADYDAALRLNPDADAYSNRGNVRNAQGDLAGALADYESALRLNPDFADAYKNRGIAWEKKANKQAAIADLQRYLELGGGQRNGDQSAVEAGIRRLKGN